jgi:glycosyltransferase involved in cell wall biosynthesis
MPPKVSVIVPIFNTRRFLATCLRSIAEQSLADIEIICVDDGSTDGSGEVVAALAAADPRIVLLRHEGNRGLGAARNTGVRAARADYIAAVDSDDYIDPAMLKALHDAAIAGDFDVVACGRREVNEQGETLRTIIPQDRTIIIENQHSDVFAITDPSVCTKLWKRSIHTDNDLYFDETTFYEDLGWTYPALLKSRRIRILGEAYYNYLLRPGSTTHSLGWRNLTDHIANFELLRRALVANGVAAQHADPFRNLVRQTLKYHAGKALELGGAGEDQLRYLRCILAIKQAYTLPGAVDDALGDAPAIIHAIEFDPPDARDAIIGRQEDRIGHLTALVRDAARLLRLPLWLSGPLSRSCIALGRLGRQPGLTRYGLSLRRLRRQIQRISRTP